MTRTVAKLENCSTAELKELALDLSIGADLRDVVVEVAEPDVRDGAPVGAVDRPVWAVCGVCHSRAVPR